MCYRALQVGEHDALYRFDKFCPSIDLDFLNRDTACRFSKATSISVCLFRQQQ